ncbi:MAG: tRNA-dihydrouridine synthase family protein [Trueperaceae bacterium]|nr:tRNA-dihydrouridine synthase family protein [Trueperaceae bacterium]
MKTVSNFYTEKLADGGAILAPMAGFTDAPFRMLCREYGSSWAVTEMVSAKGMVLGDLKGIEIGEPYPDEPNLVIQVFGGEPELVAAGSAKLYELYKPKAIDLNMGCPVKKITGKSCGSKLMQDPERAAEIVATLNASVPVPVSAKMRLGFDQLNVLEVAQAVEAAGASMIAVHGRTAVQKYTGEANWEAIAEVAQALTIPVAGSGDVGSKAQFELYKSWGLGVMIARASIGQPWVFAELLGKETLSLEEKIKTAYRHALLHLNWYGAQNLERERHLMRQFRGQLLKYFAFLPESKSELIKIESLAALQNFILEYFALDFSGFTSNELRRDYSLI